MEGPQALAAPIRALPSQPPRIDWHGSHPKPCWGQGSSTRPGEPGLEDGRLQPLWGTLAPSASSSTHVPLAQLPQMDVGLRGGVRGCTEHRLLEPQGWGGGDASATARPWESAVEGKQRPGDALALPGPCLDSGQRRRHHWEQGPAQEMGRCCRTVWQDLISSGNIPEP